MSISPRWQQLPEQSEQLKREKLELGAALLQLLKEAAQRCPSAMLEPMLKGATLGPDIQRYAQEMMGFLLSGGLGVEVNGLIGLQNPKESGLRAVMIGQLCSPESSAGEEVVDCVMYLVRLAALKGCPVRVYEA
ncbi:unnamed protein product [Cladocopium goreaui]|uniref:Exportin-T (Exportin(tRNA)) (tRNA exportin) n=1 Tax=Cladocopium goreaui TaxID=2562237 RepID=A0A9P1FKP7_9DINO|nr:unnamed protein product [Cladocopium goreaui]